MCGAEGTRTPDLVAASHALFPAELRDRKSTRLNSSHSQISYAVFCLKKTKHSEGRYERPITQPPTSACLKTHNCEPPSSAGICLSHVAHSLAAPSSFHTLLKVPAADL